jgi:hypothetical protein
MLLQFLVLTSAVRKTPKFIDQKELSVWGRKGRRKNGLYKDFTGVFI